MATFSSTLLDIATNNIPKTSPFPNRKAKPWFDVDCWAVKKERNKANRLANKHPSAANSMGARLIQVRQKKNNQTKEAWLLEKLSIFRQCQYPLREGLAHDMQNNWKNKM